MYSRGPVANEKERRDGLHMMHLNAVFRPRIRGMLSEVDKVLALMDERDEEMFKSPIEPKRKL